MGIILTIQAESCRASAHVWHIVTPGAPNMQVYYAVWIYYEHVMVISQDGNDNNVCLFWTKKMHSRKKGKSKKLKIVSIICLCWHPYLTCLNASYILPYTFDMF